MFVVNSRLGFSSAAGSSFLRGGVHRLRLSFSRSYGYILPSSLTRVFPRTLGFSPRLPVSVCGTGMVHLNSGPPWISLSVSSRPYDTDLPVSQPTAFDALFHPRAQAPSCVTPSSSDALWYWNFCQLSFAYALCLGLGPDLP